MLHIGSYSKHLVCGTFQLIKQYEADSDALRVDFERFGPIKSYFDIVKNRGMVFITYVRALFCLCYIIDSHLPYRGR